MYGRGRMWIGMWPGRGPFSFLPPWQRPGWIFGRGACWWLLAQAYGKAIQKFQPYGASPEDELAALEEYKKELEEEIKGVEARIEELRKQKK